MTEENSLRGRKQHGRSLWDRQVHRPFQDSAAHFCLSAETARRVRAAAAGSAPSWLCLTGKTSSRHRLRNRHTAIKALKPVDKGSNCKSEKMLPYIWISIFNLFQLYFQSIPETFLRFLFMCLCVHMSAGTLEWTACVQVPRASTTGQSDLLELEF